MLFLCRVLIKKKELEINAIKIAIFCIIGLRNNNPVFHRLLYHGEETFSLPHFLTLLLPAVPVWIFLLRPPSKLTCYYGNHLAMHNPVNAFWFLSFHLDAYYLEGKNPPYSMLCPGLYTKQLVRKISVKLTELDLRQESSTQEEVLTNKEAEQQLLEVITLASIWRLFGSFFHFLANGIRGSAADNSLWHGDLNRAVCRSPDIQGAQTLISTEKVGDQRLRVIKPHRTAKTQSCCSCTLEKTHVQSNPGRGISVGCPWEKCTALFCYQLRKSL